MKQTYQFSKLNITRFSLVIVGITSIAFVFAHATIVIVTLSLVPLTPVVDEPLAFSLYLETPLQVPVEDAIILLEAKPKDGETTQTIKVDLLEDPENPGSYQGELTPNKEGAWDFWFRDQTYKAEEASQHIEILVGEENFPNIEFLFPPTATENSNRLSSWLIWVIGLPIVAAIGLTVFVLTSGSKEDSSQEQ